MSKTVSANQVTIYTDGASLGNPGPGGYGVVLLCDGHRRELQAGFRLTTNNRMEVLAAIVGIETLHAPCRVTLYSDSKYLVHAMRSGAAQKWRNNDWRLHPHKANKAKNSDLWERLLVTCEDHEVTFLWVKGHANIEENERCDELSVLAASQCDLEVDEAYERENPNIRPRPSFNKLQPPNASTTKGKVTRVGQPCRKCGEPVVRREPRTRRKQGKSYYYEYYLFCPGCRTIYMVDEAKRPL
jgi:ribonuclease HI